MIDRLLWFIAGAVASPLLFRFVLFRFAGLHVCAGHPSAPLFPDKVSREPRPLTKHEQEFP